MRITYCPNTNWAKADRIEAERRQRRAHTMLVSVACVVIDLVHPGNLGPLPPSPAALIAKAKYLDLLTHEEWYVLSYDL